MIRNDLFENSRYSLKMKMNENISYLEYRFLCLKFL